MCLGCNFESKALCRLKYHVICGPTSESRLLEGPLADSIKKSIEKYAKEKQWKLEEVSYHDNLAHIVLELPHTITLDEVVRTLKDASSKGVQADFSHFEEFTHNKGFWAEGYIAQTLDGFTSEEEFLDFISDGH